MPRVCYIANQLPSAVEPYVMEEIGELLRRGVEVIACSMRPAAPHSSGDAPHLDVETVSLFPLNANLARRATALCLRRSSSLKDLFARLLRGPESLPRRLRALVHTWLGAYCALLLGDRHIDHIHIHHGYFASWVGMVAARLLEIDFSLTLHGSDMLQHAAYLDTKLRHCRFCLTVSHFNQRHLIQHYPHASAKIFVRRLGVETQPERALQRTVDHADQFILLSIGRLHPVKDHAFLVRACRRLKDQGFSFLCLIAGDGPEREPILKLIRQLGLLSDVRLLGHLSRRRLHAYYAACDLVVLTSRSEGVPLVLMEAMAHGRLVLAPELTGIPELVVDGETGFLYTPASLEEFVGKIRAIRAMAPVLGPLRHAARRHVLEHFNREKNLAAFGDFFLAQIDPAFIPHEDSLLQQI